MHPVEVMVTSLTDSLLRNARDLGDNPAVWFRGSPISYRDLGGWSCGLANQLSSNGIGPGCRVALCAPNSPAFVAGLFGIMLSGSSVVCMSPESTPTELGHMWGLTEPDASVVFTAIGLEPGSEVAGPRFAVDEEGMPGWDPADRLEPMPQAEPDDEGLIGFTSGSTGAPKAVAHRRVTVDRSSKLFVRDVLKGQRSTLVATLPLYHLGGLALILGPAILTGSPVVLMPRFDTADLLEIIERHGVKVIMAIPAMMELLFLRESLAERDLPSLERVVLGGAPVSNLLVRRIQDSLGVGVQVGYGQTECPGFWSITRIGESADRIGPYVGRPTEGYEVCLQDDEGRIVRPGEQGEICIRSRFALLGYAEGRRLLSGHDAGGWFHSGDVGSLSDDNALEILGRKKEMYIRGGYNVYPREVESVLSSCPGVSQVVVQGIPDEILGEKGCAWVVPDRGTQLSPAAVVSHARRFLTSYKIPDVIHITTSLPMNDIGKVDKRRLTRLHMEITGTVGSES